MYDFIFLYQLSLFLFIVFYVAFMLPIPALVEESCALCDVLCDVGAIEPGHLQAGGAVLVV